MSVHFNFRSLPYDCSFLKNAPRQIPAQQPRTTATCLCAALSTFCDGWLCIGRFAVSVSCLAASCFSGPRGLVAVETPGSEQEAAAIGGFAWRTHRGSQAVQDTTTLSLMAIPVRLSWLCFAIFHFLYSAIRLDSARAQPRQTGEPAGSTGTQHPALSTQHEPLSGPRRLASSIACKLIAKESADYPGERQADIISVVQVEPRCLFCLTRNPRSVEGSEGTSGESDGPSLRCMCLYRS